MAFVIFGVQRNDSDPRLCSFLNLQFRYEFFRCICLLMTVPFGFQGHADQYGFLISIDGHWCLFSVAYGHRKATVFPLLFVRLILCRRTVFSKLLFVVVISASFWSFAVLLILTRIEFLQLFHKHRPYLTCKLPTEKRYRLVEVMRYSISHSNGSTAVGAPLVGWSSGYSCGRDVSIWHG